MFKTAFRKISIIAYTYYNGEPRKFEFKRLTAKDRRRIIYILNSLVRGMRVIIVSNAQYCIKAVESEYGTTEHIYADMLADDEDNGDTLEGRLKKYIDRFGDEAEAWIAAGLTFGLTRPQLQATFNENVDNPYENTLFMSTGETKASATQRVLNTHYGKGSIRSAFGSLARLAVYFCASAFREAQRNIPDVRGWLVGRGSSYPCDICQSQVGIHKDSIDLPPYHSHCCCWAAPLTPEEYALLL